MPTNLVMGRRTPRGSRVLDTPLDTTISSAIRAVGPGRSGVGGSLDCRDRVRYHVVGRPSRPGVPTNVPAVDVRLVDVVKRFGEMVAVDHIDLEVEDGEFFSLLGPSGC